MIRRTRLLDRSVQHRDARLFVVATEGAETEPRYFHAVQERDLVPRSRVKIHVLPAEDGLSAPAHIVARVETFLAEYRIEPTLDQVWVLLDTDLQCGGRIAQLSELATLCRQKGWNLAVSHPCFEVWLLLHVTDDLGAITDRCDSVTAALRARLGGYSKASTPDACLIADALERAIARASAGDAGGPWPTTPGTRVHALLSALRASRVGAPAR